MIIWAQFTYHLNFITYHQPPPPSPTLNIRVLWHLSELVRFTRTIKNFVRSMWNYSTFEKLFYWNFTDKTVTIPKERVRNNPYVFSGHRSILFIFTIERFVYRRFVSKKNPSNDTYIYICVYVCTKGFCLKMQSHLSVQRKVCVVH